MNAPLSYTPAYVGLFASLTLALACNAFLDIRYGSFTFEMTFWTLLFAWTVRTGWRQRGVPDGKGKRQQKIMVVLAVLLTLLLFIPKWGMPRAVLYSLAALQAAQNCVTTTRRHLHFALLVSAVMVMFAASHYRADWTMLFYLVPYIISVVFTLVSEQISRHVQSVRAASLGDTGPAGQGIAIAAATAMIFSLAGVLYLVTPQLLWPYLDSKYGQESNLGFVKGSGHGVARSPDGAGGAGSGGSSGSAGGGAPDAGQQQGRFAWSGLPSPAQMREAAGREGMPGWQAAAIRGLADLSEAVGNALAPVGAALEQLKQRLRNWLSANRTAISYTLFALLLAMLAAGCAMLLRDMKPGVWLRTRLDYWYLARLGRHAHGTAGAIQFYRAMERLFRFHDQPRPANANTREFLRGLAGPRDDAHAAATELTRLFEQFRYGPAHPEARHIGRMRQLYCELYERLD